MKHSLPNVSKEEETMNKQWQSQHSSNNQHANKEYLQPRSRRGTDSKKKKKKKTQKSYWRLQLQWTLVTTKVFVPTDVAVKMNLKLYNILNEQIDI